MFIFYSSVYILLTNKVCLSSLSAATRDDNNPIVLENGLNTDIIKESLKCSTCVFCATIQELSDESRSSMVQCDTCSTWYHCVCIGVHVDHFDNGQSFNCCIPLPPDKNFESVIITQFTLIKIQIIMYNIG